MTSNNIIQPFPAEATHTQHQITFMKELVRLFSNQEKSSEGQRLAALLTEEVESCQQALKLSEGSQEALEDVSEYISGLQAALALVSASVLFKNQNEVVEAILDFVKVFRKSE